MIDGISSRRFDLRHATTDHPTFVTAGERRMFAIDGVGSFSAADFRLATLTLRDVDHRLRSMVPGDPAEARPPSIQECAWWWPTPDDPDAAIRTFADRSTWRWRQMVEVDQRADEQAAGMAIRETARHAGRDAALVRTTGFHEGPAAQLLHLGTRATASGAVRVLVQAIRAEGGEPGPFVHELVLADEHDVPAARARMIVRVPISTGSSG